MARFEPFCGLRYRPGIDLDLASAPPYDVVDAAERLALAERSPFNVAALDMPLDEGGGGGDRYRTAARLLDEWRSAGVLFSDPAPAFYPYRMGWRDPEGRPQQVSGVIGALEVATSDVLPHERTTPRAMSDRLELTRATAHNLSPIWCLSTAEGLSGLAEPTGPPAARCTDELGVHHRLWRMEAPAAAEAIGEVVASTPLLIADGHHRYETALAYRRERRAAAGGGAGAHDLTMALVVELAEVTLSVGPIHRLLTGLPPDLDLLEALSPLFEAEGPVRVGPSLAAGLVEADALGLVLPGPAAWLLHPRADRFPAGLPDLDASRLEVACAALAAHDVRYEADAAEVVGAAGGTAGTAGFLLRPATIAQIAATARGGERLPPKTTYFAPKPRTGLVLRPLA